MIRHLRAAALAVAVLAAPALAHAAGWKIEAPRDIGGAVLHAESFGVKGDGETVNTKALQAAIDATAARHGTLVFKPGVYVTGSVFLKSGMAMRIDKGVHLQGAQKLSDYDQRPTRIAGIEMTWPSALINVYRQSDVRLYGEGVIDGDGKVFWDSFTTLRAQYEPKGLRWAADYDAQRPRLIQVYESSRVEVGGGLKMTRSGFWTLQIVYSNNVKVSGIVVRNNIGGRGPSTDGVDIDSSRYVLVENADIENNDDALCLKAGRDADGQRVNRPTEHVLIRNSVIRNSVAGVTFGSETAGGMTDVEVYGLKVIGPVQHGVLLKSAATRGGTMTDLYLHDIDVVGARYGFSVELNWNPAYSYTKIPDGMTGYPDYWKVLTTPVSREKGMPHYRNVRVENLKVRGAQAAVRIDAYADAPVEHFSFRNVDIEAKTAGFIRHARDVTFTNSRIKAEDGKPMVMDDAMGISGL